MFTGIIEETGKVNKITYNGNSALLEISCNKVLDDVKLGDSIAVNGVCLTVTSFNKCSFTADVSSESLNRTSLKNTFSGKKVNLERAMQMGGRFGGHIVQGHVDDTATVLEINKTGDFWNIRVEIPEKLKCFISEKGSVTLDGISLTVAKDLGNSITVAVIPHTYSETNLSTLSTGDKVNIEVDVIARYIAKLTGVTDNNDERLLALLKGMQ